MEKTYNLTNVGLQATKFRDKFSKQVVIAFRGTEGSWDDISTDLGLAFGVPEQFSKALEIMEPFKNSKDNIVFTGHSLGGGLAMSVGYYLDRPAYVFNTAPIPAAIAKSPNLAGNTFNQWSQGKLFGFAEHNDPLLSIALYAKHFALNDSVGLEDWKKAFSKTKLGLFVIQEFVNQKLQESFVDNVEGAVKGVYPLWRITQLDLSEHPENIADNHSSVSLRNDFVRIRKFMVRLVKSK